MAETSGKTIKTDRREAEKIARCLAYHLYKPVYVPDEEDDAVKEYIRMRDDVKAHLKETKQQIIAYYTRHGFQFDGQLLDAKAFELGRETAIQNRHPPGGPPGISHGVLRSEPESGGIRRMDRGTGVFYPISGKCREAMLFQRYCYPYCPGRKWVISTASDLPLSMPLIWVSCPVSIPAAISSTVLESPKQETAICAGCLLSQRTAMAVAMWVKNPKH